MEKCHENSDLINGGIRETTEFSFTEANSDYYQTKLRLRNILVSKQSKYQRVEVIETLQFGKTLVIDGKTQSTAFDEHVYHEALVHPAMLGLNGVEPRTVFVGGGGEYATAREVLRYNGVEKVVMVDLDEEACEICEKYLPEWNQGCINDSRLEIVYGDAKEYLENYNGKFDVIIMDVCDPIECGPAYMIYTKEFYKKAASKLNDYGVIVTQAGPSSLYNFKECFSAIFNTMKQCFNKVLPYAVTIPSFTGEWGFVMALKGLPKNSNMSRLESYISEKVDEAIARNDLSSVLRFYDGITHQRMFSLAKPIRQGLDREARIITMENPVFMY